MHFAVRLGLLRLTWFLLQQPGGRGAVSVPNSEGATPVSLALERGYHKLHQLLTQEGASEPDSWSTLSHTVRSGEYSVKYHRGLDIYTLTAEVKRGTTSGMENNISCLQTFIQSCQHTTVSEHPHPPPKSAIKGCCSNTESGGLAAAPNHSTEEGNGAGPSASANLNAMPILVPACPKEESCKQPEEPLSTLQSSGSPQGAEEPECVPHNQNKVSLVCKEEEEEPPAAVDSGEIPDTSDSKLSSGARLEGAVQLPCSGAKQKGIGMNSSDRGLEKGNLGEQSNLHPEVEAVEGRTTGRSCEPPTSCDAGMGQAECKSCTGTADGPAVVQHGVENGGSDGSPSESQAVEVSAATRTDPAVSCFVDVSGVAACRDGEDVPEQPGAPQNNGNLGMDTNAGPIESGVCRQVGADLQTDSAKHLEDPKLPAKEAQKLAPSPEMEAVAMNAAPKCDCLLEANDNKEQAVIGDAGVAVTDLRASVQNDNTSAKVENSRPDVEPEAACAGDRIGEFVSSLQGEKITSGRAALGTETPRCSCGGSADLTSLHQGDVAACRSPKEGVGRDDFGSSSELCTSPAVVCEPVPGCLSPAMSSPAKEEPPKSPEVVETHCKLDGSSQSTENKILAVASALLEEVIQQAQLIVAQVVDATAAPAGQEASPHPEALALPLRGEGTECVQGNLMGTPSAIHHKESKQNQEVAAEAATQLTAVVEQGSPLPDELPAGTCLPVDHLEKNKEDSSSSQPSSSKLGQERPGKAECFSEAPALEAVAQSPPCDQSGELPESRGNAEPGLKVGACGLEAEENVRAGAAAGGLQGPALLEGTSAGADGAPRPPDIMLSQEAEPSPSLQASSPPCGSSLLVEAPLVSGELPALAELPRTGEEVGNVSPRPLLQPIAEEPLGDCDSGSEGFFLASEEGPEPEAAPLEIVAQPHASQRKAEPEPHLLPPSPSAPVEEVGAKASVQTADATFPEQTAGKPDPATLPHGSLGSVAGNPMETPPLMESRPADQHMTDAVPISGGEMDLSWQSGGQMKRAANLEAARPSPVTGA
ncbi:UNVERIFIED_CONTAM: hypothetical protein K2H54_031213 [Gekko kuhli]